MASPLTLQVYAGIIPPAITNPTPTIPRTNSNLYSFFQLKPVSSYIGGYLFISGTLDSYFVHQANIDTTPLTSEVATKDTAWGYQNLDVSPLPASESLFLLNVVDDLSIVLTKTWFSVSFFFQGVTSGGSTTITLPFPFTLISPNYRTYSPPDPTYGADVFTIAITAPNTLIVTYSFSGPDRNRAGFWISMILEDADGKNVSATNSEFVFGPSTGCVLVAVLYTDALVEETAFAPYPATNVVQISKVNAPRIVDPATNYVTPAVGTADGILYTNVSTITNQNFQPYAISSSPTSQGCWNVPIPQQESPVLVPVTALTNGTGNQQTSCQTGCTAMALFFSIQSTDSPPPYTLTIGLPLVSSINTNITIPNSYTLTPTGTSENVFVELIASPSPSLKISYENASAPPTGCIAFYVVLIFKTGSVSLLPTIQLLQVLSSDASSAICLDIVTFSNTGPEAPLMGSPDVPIRVKCDECDGPFAASGLPLPSCIYRRRYNRCHLKRA